MPAHPVSALLIDILLRELMHWCGAVAGFMHCNLPAKR